MSGRRKLFIASLAVAVLLVPVFVCLFVAAVDTDGKGLSTIKLFVWDTLLAIANPLFWHGYSAQPPPERTLIGLNIAHGQAPIEVINDIGCDYVTYRVFASDDPESVKESLEKLTMPFRIQYMQVKQEVQEVALYERNIQRTFNLARDLNCPLVPFRFPHRGSCGIETVSDAQTLWAIAHRYADGVPVELYATGDLDLWWLCSLVKRLDPKPAAVHYWNFHDSARLRCDNEKDGWTAAYPEQCHYAFALFGRRVSVWGTMIQKSRFARAYDRRYGIDYTAIHFDWPAGADETCEACQVEYAKRGFKCHAGAVEEVTWIAYKDWSDVWRDGELTGIGKVLKSLCRDAREPARSSKTASRSDGQAAGGGVDR